MSANLSAANQIKLFWDHFFYAETGTYEVIMRIGNIHLGGP